MSTTYRLVVLAESVFKPVDQEEEGRTQPLEFGEYELDDVTEIAAVVG